MKSTLHHGDTNTGQSARSSSTPSTTSIDTSVVCQPSLTSATTVTVSPGVAVIVTEPFSLRTASAVTSPLANVERCVYSSWARMLITL